MDPYDSLPYESIAFAETHPANLGALGRLFGLDTADPNRCRGLELGCASGGNLIPVAWHHRGSTFLGVDLSAQQIESARAVAERLGLTNLQLRQADILSLDRSLGRFDYVIAHGVYSWVPAPVREHLLALAAEVLAPDGLLYVSYNTLPGWRMRGMLRDILGDACREAPTPLERIAQARRALERLEAAIAGLEAASAEYLREEIAHLRGTHPSYLLFEYLAEHNQAFLFRDFTAAAQRHGLRYLCDTELRTLFPSTYGEGVDRALADIEDGIELEQWLDFVTNRNFRQSVLCRADATLDDEIDLERFAALAFACDLTPAEKVDLRDHTPVPFATPAGRQVQVTHPLTKALLQTLADHYPDCLPLDDLLPRAAAAVAARGAGACAGEVDACLAELFSLYAHRSLVARPRGLRRRPLPGHPRASPLTLAQLEAGAGCVATLHHGNLDVDDFAVALLRRLDGSRSAEQAAAALAEDLAAGRLRPPGAADPRGWPRKLLLERARAAAADLIRLFDRQGVLAAVVEED